MTSTVSGKAGAVGVPFQEATDHFRSKVSLPTATWTDIWQEQHSRAFVVAGAMRDDLLTDFRNAIDKAIAGGATIADFRKDFDSIVARHGWSYKGGRGWRTRVIYNTNLRQAHMSGRWAQVQRVKEKRPYLRYVSVLDDSTRNQHRAWHGTVLPVDHPWWSSHYPMNGWGCRCTVQSLSERELKAYGYSVTDAPHVNDVEMVPHTIKTPFGERNVFAPKGVDPGFAYNPGEAAWGRTLSDAAVANYKASGEWTKWTRLTPGDWKTAGRPAMVPADSVEAKLGKKAASRDEAAAMLKKALGGVEEKVFILLDGSALLVNAESLADYIGLERTPFIPLLPELLEKPYEVWLSFERHEATGRVALRKRLVKMVDAGKSKALVLVAHASKGMLEGWTFLPANRARELMKNRAGKLLWGR